MNHALTALLSDPNVSPEFKRALEPIQTHHEFPPIPDRRFDWCAYRDAEGLVGWGRTEAAAIADLESLEEEQQP